MYSKSSYEQTAIGLNGNNEYTGRYLMYMQCEFIQKSFEKSRYIKIYLDIKNLESMVFFSDLLCIS